ncbi:chitin-binding protein [Microbacterium phyllosphaerae]|nr:chitin-binding protein [Microbacterium phyllosphaerae]
MKNDVSTGPVEVAWNFTAAHMTTEWRYYMTLPGWDPNDPLDRGDFELIGTVEHDGSAASNNPVHTVDIPEDRSGYHVIYAVWDVADTANAFYNVIDVNVDGASRDEEAPTAAGGVTATATSGSTADVSWTAATDNVGVTGYDVYLNDVAKPAASVKGNVTKAALEGLKPETTYDVRVVAKDAAGNRSASTTASLVTPEASEDTHAPSAPSHLHAMSVTAQSVDLMWGASKDNVAVVGYDVLDAKTKDVLGHAAGTRLLVEGLTADTEYAFEVVARDAAGNTSAASNVLTVTTAAADSSLPQWDAFESYVKGDRVSFEGKTYEAVQGYQGHGDPNWITALSLWRLV